MLGLGRLDVEARGFGKTVDLRKDPFKLVRAQKVIQLSTSCGNQEKDTPQRDLQFLHQRDNAVDLADIPATECGVDLHWEANLIRPAHSVERPSEGSAHSAEGVMRFGTRTVHAHGQSGEASLFEPDDDFPRQQGRSAGRQRDSDSNRAGMANQIEEIRPLDRIPAGQHKGRDFERRDLVDQMFAFIGAQFQRIAIRLRGCAAVDASEIARLGYFPDGNEWPFVEVRRVDLRVHVSMK